MLLLPEEPPVPVPVSAAGPVQAAADTAARTATPNAPDLNRLAIATSQSRSGLVGEPGDPRPTWNEISRTQWRCRVPRVKGCRGRSAGFGRHRAGGTQ